MRVTVDIERIRVPAERTAWAFLDGGRSAFTPQDTAAQRRRLQGTALFLKPASAPEACAAASQSRERLGFDDRIELSQSGQSIFDAARLALYGAPIGIELLG